jgi:hypothetical protein
MWPNQIVTIQIHPTLVPCSTWAEPKISTYIFFLFWIFWLAWLAKPKVLSFYFLGLRLFIHFYFKPLVLSLLNHGHFLFGTQRARYHLMRAQFPNVGAIHGRPHYHSACFFPVLGTFWKVPVWLYFLSLGFFRSICAIGCLVFSFGLYFFKLWTFLWSQTCWNMNIFKFNIFHLNFFLLIFEHF